MHRQKQFKSRIEFETELKGRMSDVLDEVYDKLLDKLIEIIKKDIYDVYEPEWYDRTYDLLDKNNWAIERNTRGYKYLKWNIYFKGENLTAPYGDGGHDPHSYIHGNLMSGRLDPNDFLAIMNQERKKSDWGMTQVLDGWGRRPFWDDFLTYCDHWYPILFKNACISNGIPIQ